MNGTNLFRLAITVLVLIWAGTEITPPTDTPFEEYIVANVSDDRESFDELMERARSLVKEYQGTPNSPYPTVYIALLRIGNDEDIDLSKYFTEIRIQDIRNINRKNRILMAEMLRRSKGEIRLGLDLNGGVAITFQVDESGLEGDMFYRQQQLEDARQVILDRVDGLGVAEPIVRVKGNNQIEVQMPGVSSADNPNIAETIGAPAMLEFKLIHRTARPDGRGTPPLGYERLVQEYEDRQSGEIMEEAVYARRIPVMTGEIIDRARPQVTQTGGYEVNMNFTTEGRRQFSEVTAQIAEENTDFSIGRLGIVLDGKMVSAPTVRERINSDSARITGNFSQREAFELANALNNPLAVPLEIAEMYEVGPTLAKDARDASVRAATWAAVIVMAFMVVYYGMAGVVSMISVVMNLFLVLGALASFGATLTLPGVAALVLTIGMAVDASILIFERIREELRSGKSIANAVTNGFDKALSTIVDANVTTLLTALVLIWLGTGPVKGFGITLAIGILATMFCSLVAMRWMMELLVTTSILKNPFKWQLFRNTSIEFLNYAKKAFIVSWALVVFGLVAFILHFDQAFGIDFTGGDEVTVSFDQRITSQDVASVAESAELGEVNIFFQSPLGSEQEFMMIQTRPEYGAVVFEAINNAYPQANLVRVGETQIGSAVGEEVTRSAILSMLIALLGILLYVAVRFEFGFGLGAVVATMHDVLMTVGIFIILGEFLGIGSGQFTAPMIAAVLMTVGYSINDTIVVFDRIREELELNPTSTLKKVIHLSINRVLNRTVLTSLTTLFASTVLFMFGAGVIKDFALVFMIGIVTGTFSSMFIASPTFFWYHKGDRRSVEKGEILPSYDWTSAENQAAKPTEEKA